MQHNADAAERAAVVSGVGCRVSGVTWHGFTSRFPSPLARLLSAAPPPLPHAPRLTQRLALPRTLSPPPPLRARAASTRLPQRFAPRSHITHVYASTVSVPTKTIHAYVYNIWPRVHAFISRV